jgi:2-keto-4-pentenoate hydratase/2-oxohepta-3-ene-1,7-dioic acid hydratase in catechol pathway
MRLVSFTVDGRPTWGALTEAGVVEAPETLRARAPTLARAFGEGLDALSAHGPVVDPARVAWLPVIPAPEKILCVGVNYHAHRAETGRAESPYPTLFTRFANTLVPHGAALVRPNASAQFDFEGELAVVIGRRGRHIPAERALAHVAGYTCFNDASVRDWQRHTTQFTPGKNFVATAGIGPWLTTADELPDPARSEVSLTVNGVEMQRSTTDLLIFDVPALIAYVSTFTELAPGDILATGTPGGVGWKRDPPVFLRHGDVVEVTVRGVGTLRNHVVDEGRA